MDASFCSGNVKAKWSLATLYAGEQVTRSVQEQHTLTTPGAPGSDGRFFAGGFTASATDMG